MGDTLAVHALQDAARAEYDVIIIGAGVMGASLAAALGHAGRRVVLIERDLSEPDRIVGELLQPGGVRALQLMGLATSLENIDAIPVQGYRIFLGNESVEIKYPSLPELPARYGRSEPLGKDDKYQGRSFHYGRFVMKLRALARASPNVTIVQATAQDLVHGVDHAVVGVHATDGGNQYTLRGSVTVIADGCNSKYRKLYGGKHMPIVRSHQVGLLLPPDVAISKEHGHVILSKDTTCGADGKHVRTIGPVLVYQIGSDATRILVDTPGPTLPSQTNGDLQRYLVEDVAPRLPGKIGTALAEKVKSGVRPRTMQSSYLPPSVQGQRLCQKGLILAGDAMNMRHPLTGGGMTVALWDAIFLTHILGDGSWTPLQGMPNAFSVSKAARTLTDWNAIQPALRTWHWQRKRLSSVINILAQALYSLFGTPDDNLVILRKGCFRYFERGGACVRDPISFLGGIAPDPMLLVYHFFAVAVYAVLLLFRGELDKDNHARPPLHAYPALLFRAIVVLYTACVVILPVIFAELRGNLVEHSLGEMHTQKRILSVVFAAVVLALALLSKIQNAAVRSPEYAKDPKNPYEVYAQWAAHKDHQMITLPNSKEKGFTEIYKNAAFPELSKLEKPYELFKKVVAETPDANCFGHRPWDEAKGDLANHFVWRSYAQVDAEATALGSAASYWLEQGLLKPRHTKDGTASEPGLTNFIIGFWGPNRPEAAVLSLAAAAYSRVTVGLYDNYDAGISCYILKHSAARILCTTSSYVPIVLRNAEKLPALKVIIVVDRPGPAKMALGELQKIQLIREWAAMQDIHVFGYNEAVETGLANLRPSNPPTSPDFVMALCYTSGTTGLPKAAMITDRMSACGVSGIKLINPDDKLVTLSYLPLAHILERGWEAFILCSGGAVGYYSGDITRLPEDLQILKPSALPAVPRVLNRIAGQIEAQMAGGGLKAVLLRNAINAKIRNYEATGTITHAFWDRLVFRKVRAMLGGNIRVMITGSAPCRPDVLRLLRLALCCDIREAYGQTENGAYATYMIPNDAILGNVGPVNPGIELRLRDQPELGYSSEDKPYPRGEILFRGDAVFPGYAGDPAKTAETLLPGADGRGNWLLTGDVGQIDEYGHVKIIDRVKNLIKLAQGEYVAIERVENVFGSHPIAQQMWLYGDSFQPHLVAICVPEHEPFAQFASNVLRKQIAPTDLNALNEAAKNDAVIEALLREFIALGKRQGLGTLEQMRALQIRMDPFSTENGLMTPTMKVKRQEAAKLLKGDLELLYKIAPYDLNKVQVSKA
ncbi:hypothetical protein MVES_001031 [Malassezia vespertilionis]|uniref:Uncharacterized protein n=1 Tax=Malassezia vespertilionis TaxID=2020962 RepID=A0A2N1JF03_9BASI|nr:hypothetical protein MVES_001031 [Malassezia vespertilionis]